MQGPPLPEHTQRPPGAPTATRHLHNGRLFTQCSARAACTMAACAQNVGRLYDGRVCSDRGPLVRWPRVLRLWAACTMAACAQNVLFVRWPPVLRTCCLCSECAARGQRQQDARRGLVHALTRERIRVSPVRSAAACPRRCRRAMQLRRVPLGAVAALVLRACLGRRLHVCRRVQACAGVCRRTCASVCKRVQEAPVSSRACVCV